MKIYLEKAKKTEEDARIIMEWRNDPETLKMFYNQELKIWDFFWKEYLNEYFTPASLTPHFALLEGKRIAFLRSSQYPISGLDGVTFDIDINVSPEMRGKGLGTEIIEMFCNHIFLEGADNVMAEVKKINISSAKAFQKAGFILFDEMTKEIRGNSSEIIRYIKKDNNNE
jgi:RimJ/RimL family protein N-acetyltransferase